MSIAALSPSLVWNHFATLCAIPRPSRHEAALREHLVAWAQGRGLQTEVDAAGNLLIRKAASPGLEHVAPLALQGHLDMVCQANSGTVHDFHTMPITAEVVDGWLVAKNTTLGADNGLGVALALAALEDDTLQHGPLEVLLTVDEEAGMGGAHGLQGGWLRATRMLNIDTEEWGEFYLGCAGGADVEVQAQWPTEPVAAGHALWTLSISGLRGGHSGVDIHLPRGNANRLLAQALQALQFALGDAVQLVSLRGGTARNALPREARAVLAVPAASVETAQRLVDVLAQQWRRTLLVAGGESQVQVQWSPAAGEPAQAVTSAAQRSLVQALCMAPYGVRAMSPHFAGVVETSNNLGVVDLQDGQFSANLMVRSLRDDQTAALAETIAVVFRSAGASVTVDGHYPGWTPNPNSALLAQCQAVYAQTFGEASRLQVIHAGLECGIINAKYPGMDAVSFGPTIRGAHAPGERVEIASVERCWTLLRTIITALAQPA
ncbi:beta-Ala-His dipeptidase [Curvibacter sp. APW13]|uniref:beta-Ala-His dipeptidase n=1 Tax=Curvibacter sp. APW13 TaxID=3077236 RepID=UPI0028E02977|nr:beta-Ala-His dipeptidase [Curvibacter sp. APW13]MDT8989255.1 beta-Ala-His dipeptidase [Curvibacter sp. APW13]